MALATPITIHYANLKDREGLGRTFEKLRFGLTGNGLGKDGYSLRYSGYAARMRGPTDFTDDTDFSSFVCVWGHPAPRNLTDDVGTTSRGSHGFDTSGLPARVSFLPQSFFYHGKHGNHENFYMLEGTIRHPA